MRIILGMLTTIFLCYNLFNLAERSNEVGLEKRKKLEKLGADLRALQYLGTQSLSLVTG